MSEKAIVMTGIDNELLEAMDTWETSKRDAFLDNLFRGALQDMGEIVSNIQVERDDGRCDGRACGWSNSPHTHFRGVAQLMRR